MYICFAYFKKNAALQVNGTLGPKIPEFWPKLAQNVLSFNHSRIKERLQQLKYNNVMTWLRLTMQTLNMSHNVSLTSDDMV